MILALGALLHYGWMLSPPAQQALVWNISGAVVRAALAVAVVCLWQPPSAWVTATRALRPPGASWRTRVWWLALVRGCPAPVLYGVAAWWVAEELAVSSCNLAFIISPWPRVPGQAMCSSLLHFDMTKVGAVLLAVLAWATTRRP